MSEAQIDTYHTTDRARSTSVTPEDALQALYELPNHEGTNFEVENFLRVKREIVFPPHNSRLAHGLHSQVVGKLSQAAKDGLVLEVRKVFNPETKGKNTLYRWLAIPIPPKPENRLQVKYKALLKQFKALQKTVKRLQAATTPTKGSPVATVVPVAKVVRLCRVCLEMIPPTGKRGRPAYTCTDCKAKS